MPEHNAERAESSKDLRVEIQERLGQPKTCKVWRNDALVFDGVDRSALLRHSPERARIALPPEPPHDCRRHLPWSSGGYGSTGLPEGTVALCPTCNRAWVCLPCYESLGPTTWWRPVCWFSRREYRRRAAALRPSPGEGTTPGGAS